MRYHTTALFALALTLTDTADAGHTSVGLVVHEEMYELLDHLRARIPQIEKIGELARRRRGVAATLAESQEPRAPEAKIATGKEGFVLPAGTISVENLIDESARYLARNILWQASELNNPAPFVFQRPLALDARGCEELVGQLLASRGLVVVPIDEQKKVYEVIHTLAARGQEISTHAVSRTSQQVLARPQLHEYVLVAQPLEHINATIATNALRPFFAGRAASNTGLIVGTAGSADTILLQGYTNQVAVCLRLIEQCDQPSDKRPAEMSLHKAVQHLQQTVDRLEAQLQDAQQRIATLQVANKPAKPKQ